ncbi:MAG TPA: redoxin domain-containing protein [Pedobacter sp.]
MKLLAAALLLPFAAFAQTKTSDLFTLRVKIENRAENTRLYLAYQVDGKKILDSAIQKNGFFILSGYIESPLNASLIADHEGVGSNQVIKRSKKGVEVDAIRFYLHPGTINIKTDRRIQNAEFSGSVINSDNERLKAMLKPINDQQMSISSQLRSGNYLVKGNQKPQPISENDSLEARRMLRQLDSLSAAEKPVLRKFIEANPASYISLVSLWSYGGRSPDIPLMETLYNRLSTSIKNTDLGREYHKLLTDRKNLIAGTKAPDFVQKDTAGNSISLSSFKGKYLLLDFWASWCSPCRKESPQLVQIFNDFRDKNFTILGISLDGASDKGSWLKAIKDDGLAWAQVSDLKKWNNQAAKLYSIYAIPQNFLIDPNGVIVAKGLNPKDLRTKLEEILSK